jgi:PAS domain-containing protein
MRCLAVIPCVEKTFEGCPLVSGLSHTSRQTREFKIGEKVFLECLETLRSPNGGPGGFILIVRDITERKRVEIELREMAERLRKSFLGIIIPSEILNKPGGLIPLEMEIVRRHAEVGYEVLKNAGLPEPIPEIVYERHERLDGSGYPRGLKGDEILLEARILAVSDVVEAMSSHRPYRPALGIETDREEIERGKGTLYDSEVVKPVSRSSPK